MTMLLFAFDAVRSGTTSGYVLLVWAVIVMIASLFISSAAKKRRNLTQWRKDQCLSKGYGWCPIHGCVGRGHKCEYHGNY